MKPKSRRPAHLVRDTISTTPARTKLLISLGVGIAGTACAVALGSGPASLLIGWDLIALYFGGWTWVSTWPLDADATVAHANRDNPGRDLIDLIVLCAAVASVVAVGAFLFQASHDTGVSRYLRVGLAVISIFLSWTLVHTVFMLKYARLYYLENGGIDFNEDDPPQYTDFAYFSFTIGMTFQVSDTNISSKQIRRAALQHAWIAFPLGALIIASAINLVAGLAR